MKKLMAALLLLACVLSVAGCTVKLAEGSEKTYCGTVTDRGMSVVKEGDRKGRAYIIIVTGAQEEICFWLGKNCENPAGIGDAVCIESAREENTGLLTAVRITVNRKGEEKGTSGLCPHPAGS